MRGVPDQPAELLEREIGSRLEEVDLACLELRAFLRDRGLAPRSFAVELVARECLNNAVLHGHRGRPDQRIRLRLEVGREWMVLSVADEGKGFAPARPRPIRSATCEGGRGLAICALYAAKVKFNRRGNRVTLWLERSGRERIPDGSVHH